MLRKNLFSIFKTKLRNSVNFKLREFNKFNKKNWDLLKNIQLMYKYVKIIPFEKLTKIKSINYSKILIKIASYFFYKSKRLCWNIQTRKLKSQNKDFKILSINFKATNKKILKKRI